MIKPDKLILTNRKTMAIKITRKGEVIVSAPKRTDLNKVFQFINSKEKWIISRQTQIKNTLILNKNLLNYEEILFLGKLYPIIYIKNQKEITLTNNALCLPSNYGFSTEKLTKNLQNWYISNANIILINRTNELIKHLKLTVNSISIIKSKAKWGMCDNKQNIYLNFKLMFLSHELIDYVILHELTHLTELNHSIKFYEELKRVLPNHKTLQLKLKKCSFLLNLFT